MLYLAIEINQN